MANLKDWILDAADGETIVGVVIGAMGWENCGDEAVPKESLDVNKRNVVLPWSEAAKLISYEFDEGYGAPGCQAITAWTASKVIFIVQYDGSTSVSSVPRNPIDHVPSMPGG